MSKAYPSNLTQAQFELRYGFDSVNQNPVVVFSLGETLREREELLPETKVTFIYLAMIRIMVRRLA